jgi:DNA (cytosine-5)-methyltransferase 1
MRPEREFKIGRSGLYVPEHLAEKPRPRSLDLFSGCGGFSLGMIHGGFEVLAGVEWDPAAAMTYLMNLGTYPCNIVRVTPEDDARLETFFQRELKRKKGENAIAEFPVCGSGYMATRPDLPGVSNFFFGDIRKLTGRRIMETLGIEPGELDCICGSPPCQGFSTAGKRDVMDPRNSLMWEYARLVVELRPKTMVLENVPGIQKMITPAGIPVIDAFCLQLADGGYSTYEALRNVLAGSNTAKAAVRDTSNKDGKKPPKKAAPAAAETSQIRLPGV